MDYKIKFFDELNTHELYKILKARSDVFVVEQKCVYPDMDEIDYNSLHVFCESEGKINAYLRAYVMEPGTVRMGRVLTLERGTGLGKQLLKTGIMEIKEKFAPERIYIEAQCYAVGFYQREGFKICSEEFFEDGIAHVKMELVL